MHILKKFIDENRMHGRSFGKGLQIEGVARQQFLN